MAILPGQNQTRRQLTLFIKDTERVIESIRKQFNPLQSRLISAHVTLCRDDEIEPYKVVQNLKSLKLDFPLTIKFDPVERFESHNGVWLPGSKENKQFHELRKRVLKGVIDSPGQHRPHLTLMHPRNSTCTDAIFDQIKQYTLPTELSFDEISWIEQKNGGQWTIKDVFRIY